VSATGRGVLTKRDFDSYLDELAAAATLSFGKIFHMAAGCRLQLSKDDLAAIRARIRSHEVHQLMGRVAVVAASDELYEQAEKFNSKVLAERRPGKNPTIGVMRFNDALTAAVASSVCCPSRGRNADATVCHTDGSGRVPAQNVRRPHFRRAET
jgi:hypothetical protein